MESVFVGHHGIDDPLMSESCHDGWMQPFFSTSSCLKGKTQGEVAIVLFSRSSEALLALVFVSNTAVQSGEESSGMDYRRRV